MVSNWTKLYAGILMFTWFQVTEKELVTREKGKEKSRGCSIEPVYKVEIPANRYDLLCPEGLSRALMIFESK